MTVEEAKNDISALFDTLVEHTDSEYHKMIKARRDEIFLLLDELTKLRRLTLSING